MWVTAAHAPVTGDINGDQGPNDTLRGAQLLKEQVERKGFVSEEQGSGWFLLWHL